MSLSTLRTQVRRLAQELVPSGQLVTVRCHDCQDPEDLEAQARRALGREWRRGDMLVVVMTEDDCISGPHQHDPQVIISPRITS